jgi:hypothetical protein
MTQSHGKSRIQRCIGAALLGLLFATVASAPGFARNQHLGFWCNCRPTKPVVRYAGDCGTDPPPGYRHDLKDWVTGFDRDFYCYMLDEY